MDLLLTGGVYSGDVDPESGFEPLLMESESIVLPLNYSGTGMKTLVKGLI